MVTLLNLVTDSILTNPHLLIIPINYSKAFDKVHHCTLLEKLAQLDIPDEACNWLIDFFRALPYSRVYRDQTSTLRSINSSIICQLIRRDEQHRDVGGNELFGTQLYKIEGGLTTSTQGKSANMLIPPSCRNPNQACDEERNEWIVTEEN